MAEQIDINLNYPSGGGKKTFSSPSEGFSSFNKNKSDSDLSKVISKLKKESNNLENSIEGSSTRFVELASVIAGLNPVISQFTSTIGQLWRIQQRHSESIKKQTDLRKSNILLAKRQKEKSSSVIGQKTGQLGDKNKANKVEDLIISIMKSLQDGTFKQKITAQKKTAENDAFLKVVQKQKGPPPLPKRPPPLPSRQNTQTSNRASSIIKTVITAPFKAATSTIGIVMSKLTASIVPFGIAAATGAIALKLMSDGINAFIGKIADFSPEVQMAKAQAEVAETLAAIRLSKQTAGAAGDIVQAQSGFKIAIMELQSSILTTFGPLIVQLVNFGSWILKAIASIIRLLEPVFTIIQTGIELMVSGINSLIEAINALIGTEIPLIEIKEEGDPKAGTFEAFEGVRRLFGAPRVGAGGMGGR